jgi:hypothetical protein
VRKMEADLEAKAKAKTKRENKVPHSSCSKFS